MTATNASERLQKLHDQISIASVNMEALQDEHAAAVISGADDAADEIAARLSGTASRLATLRLRIPVLEQLAEQEATQARLAEAEQLRDQANGKFCDLQAGFAKAAKLVEQLKRTVADIDENAPLHWYLLASKSAKMGGNPARPQIEGLRQLLDSLESSKRRLINIAEDYSGRATQIMLTR